ncbi:MAG: ATP-dependent helicase [Acidobacteriota bacterium]|nr:MAG: ATP-dependent helicase [Acidobacteriota bacterium]
MQILAGPGSGKTEMLTWRVLYELFVLGTPATQLLVTTFTRRAATELQVRLVERCDAFIDQARRLTIVIDDPHVHDVRIGTIHSLCDSLLAEFSDSYVADGIQLIDDVESSVRLVRNYRFVIGYLAGRQRLLNRLLNYEELVALFRPPWDQDSAWPANNMERVEFIKTLIAQHIETWESRCAGPPRCDNGVEQVHGITGLTDELVELERRWREDHLIRNNLTDFTTIQKLFLFHQNDLLAHFRHVFVDEFQDTNPIQFMIHTGWLRNPLMRLTVVGDDDQAIYRFRGSDLACFQGIEPFCKRHSISHRLERLEVNHRSTKTIVAFTQAFRNRTILPSLSMPKNIQAESNAPSGAAVRLLEGSWLELSEAVASELKHLGVGRVPITGQQIPPSVAILLFSASERSSRRYDWSAPALTLRQAVENKDIRVYNPRNKTAAQPESPVGMLLGLISYLIDPITEEPVGRNGRRVMVWASSDDPDKSRAALSQPPTHLINQKHIDFQKKFRNDGGRGIGPTPTDRQPLLRLIDDIRANLAAPNRRRQPRLTLAGLVYRLLSRPFFRNSGFTMEMFRQALFTQLMEANIAPTRLTRDSIDQPLEVSMQGNKYVWPDRFWDFLGYFGALVGSAGMDDLEVESFEDNAVLLITFHQAKGLEFDHVYVAGMGRTPDITPVLRTKLFSGENTRYRIVNGIATTRIKIVKQLSEADREREVYVAMTRARQSLTLLNDPAGFAYMNENQAINQLFQQRSGSPHPDVSTVIVKEWTL